MTFRNSHWVGLLLCTTFTVTITPLMSSAHAETLKITGPNGEVRQTQQQYGPTTSKDTFWSIAQKVRPNDKVSVYQVMAAIFDANPHAFSGNNYNTLERGMILIIPSVDVMTSISPQEAKIRAENNDKAIKQGITTPKSDPQTAGNNSTVDNIAPVVNSPKAASAEKPLQIVQQAPVTAPDTPAQTVKSNQTIKDLSAELDKANNKNVMITDELARAQDQLMVTRTDNQVLKQKIEELSLITGTLEEELQLLREKHQSLMAKHEMLINEQQQENQPAIEQPTDFWRTLTNNTALLIAAAALPLIVIFGLIFWLMRRRSTSDSIDSHEAVKPVDSDTETGVANQAKVSDEDDLDALAVHLDSDHASSIDDLLDLDSLDLQPEAQLQMDDDQMDMASEMFIAENTEDEPEIDEEGTSLDDLWAEAMDEQDSELEPLETDDDLDNLLAGLDDPIDEPNAEIKADEDDIDSLLANLGNEQEQQDSASNDNVDDILADFDFDNLESDDVNPPSNELADEIASELEPEVQTNIDIEDDVAEDDIDSLLAGFNADDSPSAIDNSDVDSTDVDSNLANEIAAELEHDSDVKGDVADDDIDALLAGFNTDDSQPTANDTEPDTNLADEIASELAEDIDIKDDVADDDIDALLAGFNTDDSQPTANDTEPDTNLADEIASELAEDIDIKDDVADDDIDALLAGFNSDDSQPTSNDTDTNLADEIASELAEEIDVKDEVADDDIDALLAGFNTDDGQTSANDTEPDTNLADDIAVELDTDIDVKDDDTEDDTDPLLAENDVSQSEAFSPETELDSLLASHSEIDNKDDAFTLQDDLSANEPESVVDSDTDVDLDSLLTELATASEEDLSQGLTPESAEEEDLSGLLSELEQASETQTDEDDVDFNLLESDLRQAEQEEYTQTALSESPSEALSAATKNDQKLAVEKESGFFNDLKASKKPQPEMLDWEADLFKAASKAKPDDLEFDEMDKLAADEQDFDFSDDDLLAAFSESLDDHESDDDYTSEDDFVLSDDNLTVDEALAALDAKQTNSTPDITEAELSNFERENGFINIDKLLNDADEYDEPVTDKYKEVDVDMGEVESLLGNADMVDVDDEENSVNAKLDLARAYIEIEDEDSAKALLKEVQMDGNERQQLEATGLLKKLT
ncbi:FimV/HubP family polar landmark protein [Shewanella aestuarii]|uniref:Pilus assembly protein FimV n=1 Tax=Shewanella aestuarii TaxID=1028752 RepID=A0A6G9QJU5_9GAMM|nr:FimV/HubP family polar landmark protein [Shewanella aestuarii]QIR14149.1 pilus assembly protein FimV [Shewanella aestuarii]